MPRGLGRGLKFLQLFFRILQFLCALIIIAITGYALASNGDDSAYTDDRHYSVIGIAVVALVYTVVAFVCLLYLSPRMWSSLIFIVFDLAFVGTSIFIAVVHGDGARNCDGNLPRSMTRVSCQLQKAVMATAISSVLLFVLSIPTEVWIVRLQLREKRIGSDPKLDGSSVIGSTGNGRSGGGFFANVFRRNTTKTARSDNVLPEHTLPQELDTNSNNRPSYGTDNTYVNSDEVDDHIYPDPSYSNTYHKYYGGGNGYQYLHPNRQAPQAGDQLPL